MPQAAPTRPTPAPPTPEAQARTCRRLFQSHRDSGPSRFPRVRRGRNTGGLAVDCKGLQLGAPTPNHLPRLSPRSPAQNACAALARKVCPNPGLTSPVRARRVTLECSKRVQFLGAFLVNATTEPIVIAYKLCQAGNKEPLNQRRPLGDHCLNRRAGGSRMRQGLAGGRRLIACVVPTPPLRHKSPR
jgi:hypothetical protein